MSLSEVLRSMGKDTANLRLGAQIGEVVDNRDPDGLGRVQLRFSWDWQGAATAAWAMPVYPLAGDLGMDPPDVGAYLLCLFLEGQPTEPFYIGMTRGKPRRDEVRALTEDGDGLHVAVAEAVDEGFRKILDWMKQHTHVVVVNAQGNVATPAGPLPLIPTPARHETMRSAQATPELRPTGAKRIRFLKRNDPERQ